MTDSANRYEPNRSQNRQKTTVLGFLRSPLFSGCFPSVVLVRKLQFLVFKYIGVPTHFLSFFCKNPVSQVVVQRGVKNGRFSTFFWTPPFSKLGPYSLILGVVPPKTRVRAEKPFFPGFSRISGTHFYKFKHSFLGYKIPKVGPYSLKLTLLAHAKITEKCCKIHLDRDS